MRILDKLSCLLVTVLVLFVSFTLEAQDFETVDATIQLYPERFNNAEELSSFISRDFISEEDKVRAIYGWIINNVAYDPDEYKQFNYNFKNYRERNLKEEQTREKIIQRTLKKGKAVCEGYSMLFEKLCELQGISSYLVRGDVKNNFSDIGREFKKIHMWNVVYIDEQPFLFDPTWGAGKFTDVFIKEPSYYYYKIRPELLIKTHYPEVVSDAFLTLNYSKQFFSKLPLVIKRDLLLSDVVSPKEGVILPNANADGILFKIKSENPKAITYSYGVSKKPIAFSSENGIVQFLIPTRENKNLLVYFDDQPALGYKVR